MANRYFDYSQIQNIEGYYKPSGTMGSHHFKVLSKSLEGITVQGSTGKTVFIKPGWNLGYNCGDVWAIKPWQEISDPIQKFLRKNHFSSKTPIRISDKPLCGNVGTASANTPSGARWTGYAWYSNWGHVSQDKYFPIEDGDVVLCKDANSDPRFFSASHVSEIVIRSHVTPEMLSDIFTNGDFIISKKPSRKELLEEQRRAHLREIEDLRQAYSIALNLETEHIVVPTSKGCDKVLCSFSDPNRIYGWTNEGGILKMLSGEKEIFSLPIPEHCQIPNIQDFDNFSREEYRKRWDVGHKWLRFQKETLIKQIEQKRNQIGW